MQEIERFIKIFFYKYNYHIEEMNINGVWEIIPLLTQGYIRCLNNLKHKIKGQDLEASEEFILTIRRALIILYKNFEFIKNNLTNPKFDIIDFLKLEDNKSGNSLIYKVFEYSQEIKNEATSNTFFKYEIKIGPIGPVVMYSGSLQMANFHQVCSYLLLFKHHLPRIKNWKYFLFFLQYMIEIDKQILDKINYASIFGMIAIIKKSTDGTKKNLEKWEEIDDNGEFVKMRFCLAGL